MINAHAAIGAYIEKLDDDIRTLKARCDECESISTNPATDPARRASTSVDHAGYYDTMQTTKRIASDLRQIVENTV